MATSPHIRREIGKSRELLWHLLDGKRCYFCHKLFIKPKDRPRLGNARAKTLNVEITIHHKDWNHSNNAPRNRELSHTSCHKSHNAHVILHGRSKKILMFRKRVA